MSYTNQLSRPVLIVGGSLVGLSAAAILADQGVRVVLVEPHLGSHPHPRAIGYTPRTMEIFRGLGLASKIPEAPPSVRLRRCKIESLSGRWYEESDWTPGTKEAPTSEPSPCRGAAIAQDKLEPILREKARELGAELRLGTKLVRFEQDSDGVTAWLRDREGNESTLRAAYMLAADGHDSSVREALGISRKGRGAIQTLRSVLFRAPLDEYLTRGISQFEIEQPGLQAFLTTYGDGRWVLMFHDDRDRDEAELRGAIARAIGREDVPVEILTTGRWELMALIAERFSEGRMFLAGDAAHTLPPTRGGFGANTGIHDVHELAWKIAAVLRGESSDELLATYDAERRPIAWTRLEQTFARPDYAKYANGLADGVTILDEIAMELGQLRRSGAVLGASSDLPEARRPDQWAGQPGTRAPHVVIERPAETSSTIDLFGHRYVLLAGSEAWLDAAKSATNRLGIAIEALLVGRDVLFPESSRFESTFGVSLEGASLIRPDGIVAWRSVALPEDSAEALTEALATVASSRVQALARRA